MIVSPHLDDAVLSLGLLMMDLVQAGVDVTVATLCTQATRRSTTLAPIFNADATGDLHKGMARRREEDLRAAQILQVSTIHGPIADASFRWSTLPEHKTVNTRDFIRAPYPQEPSAMHNAILYFDSQIEEFSPECVAVPLGLGGHVDHLLARAAAEAAILKSHIRSVIYYEDMPYAFSESLRQPPLRQPPLRQRFTKMDAWSRKVEAINCYESQLGFLGEHWEEDFRTYGSSFGLGRVAERYFMA